MIRAIIFVLALPLVAQETSIVMPGWLKPFGGASADVRKSSPALIETVSAVQAPANEVVQHYKQLFSEAKVEVESKFDGIGTSLRAAAPECDLLLKIREDSGSTTTVTSCATKTNGPLSGQAMGVTQTRVGSTRSSTSPISDPDKWRAEHRQRMADNSAALQRRIENARAGKPFDQVWPDAPENNAPPLAWPSWLVHMKGRAEPREGVDQSSRKYLESKFVTSAPMTEIFNFYEDLLNSNGFKVHNSKLGTGQSLSGHIQNASGYVEGTQYTYDNTGPRTVIHVSFSRSYLNDPITVRIRLTPHPRF